MMIALLGFSLVALLVAVILQAKQIDSLTDQVKMIRGNYGPSLARLWKAKAQQDANQRATWEALTEDANEIVELSAEVYKHRKDFLGAQGRAFGRIGEVESKVQHVATALALTLEGMIDLDDARAEHASRIDLVGNALIVVAEKTGLLRSERKDVLQEVITKSAPKSKAS
jgi:hypothetical protein